MDTGIYDYAIVGAGLIGSAAAKYICRSVGLGTKVCLIGPVNPTTGERLPGSNRLAFGAHDDEGRIVQSDGIADPVYAELARKSVARFRDIETESEKQFYHEAGALVVLGLREQSKDIQQYVDRVLTTSSGRASLVQPVSDHFPFLSLPPTCCGIVSRVGAGHVSPRNMVTAQIRLAQRSGCQLYRDTVLQMLDSGYHYTLKLESGITVRAERVLLANGTCSVWPDLLPHGMQVDAQPETQTVLLVEVTEDAAHNQLVGMPSMWIRDVWAKTASNSKKSPGLCYCLPPIQYPNGRWYLKIGHGKLHDKPLPANRESIADWYKSGGSEEVGQNLFDISRSLFPSVVPLSLSLDSCATLSTPSGQPYIDTLPGVKRPGSLVVAVGGNGVAAKTCDEVGRLAAGLSVKGKWLSDLPRDRFAVKLKTHPSRL